MRNKILFPLIGLILLSSCQDVSDGNVPLTWKENEYIRLGFEKESYTLERGAYLILKLNIDTNKQEASKKIDYVIEQDGKIIQFEGENKGIESSVVILGKNIGKAKVKAVSLDDRSVIASCDIEVIRHIPSLSKVWENVNEQENYTLLTRRKSKLDSIKTPYTALYVTDEAILFEGLVKQENEYQSYPLFEDNKDNSYVLGYGIDKNENAFEIHLNEEGEYSHGSSIVKTERGFLTKDNYRGFKGESLSMNDVGYFYGLQAINPQWLPKAKAVKDEYVIDDQNLYSGYVKYLLWGLIDPLGRISYLNKYGAYKDVSDVVSVFSLTIKANSNDEVSFTLEYDDGIYINSSSENYIYETTMLDIGSTEISDFIGLPNFLDGYIASYPKLNQTLSLVEKAILNNDYIYQRELYWLNPKDKDNPYHAYFYVYYTKQYMMAYFSKEMAEAYHNATGEIMDVEGIGYLKANDGLHMFAYHPEKEEILLGDVIGNTKDVSIWEYDFSLAKDYRIPNYLSNSVYIKSKTLNSLSDVPAFVFSNLPSYYYTHNKKAFDDFCMWYMGETVQGNDYYDGIHVELEEGKLKSIDFFAAYADENNAYKLLYAPTLTNFGNAEKKNEADALIKEVIKSI